MSVIRIRRRRKPKNEEQLYDRRGIVASVLKETPLAVMAGDDLDSVRIIELKKGDCLARKGSPLSGVYVVVNGEVGVVEDRKILATATRPALVNAVAAATGLKNSFETVVVLKTSRLLRVAIPDFRRCFCTAVDALDHLDRLLETDVSAHVKRTDDDPEEEPEEDDEDDETFGPGTVLMRRDDKGRVRYGQIIREVDLPSQKQYYEVAFEASRWEPQRPGADDALTRLPTDAWRYVHRIRTQRFTCDDGDDIVPARVARWMEKHLTEDEALAPKIRYAAVDRVYDWAVNAIHATAEPSTDTTVVEAPHLKTRVAMRPSTAPYRRPSFSSQRPTVTLLEKKTPTTTTTTPITLEVKTTKKPPRQRPLSAPFPTFTKEDQSDPYVPLAPPLPARPSDRYAEMYMSTRRPPTPRYVHYDSCRKQYGIIDEDPSCFVTSPKEQQRDSSSSKCWSWTNSSKMTSKTSGKKKTQQQTRRRLEEPTWCMRELRALEAITQVVLHHKYYP